MALPSRPEPPRPWIVAGPNGSGKSTVYTRGDIEGFGHSVWIINPDLLAARIREQERRPADLANIDALNRIEAWLQAAIRAYQTNVERVRLRVLRGGHDVAEDRIRARRERSFQQLPWFLDQADLALIYDNSGTEPQLVGQKRNGVTVLDPSVPEPIRRVLETPDD